MYTAWMACLTPDKALYNFGRQNEHRHNLFSGKRNCRAGVRHALLITGGRPRPRRHSLRDIAFIASAAVVLLTGCIDPGNSSPLKVTLDEPSPVSAELAQAPLPRTKPKPPVPGAATSAAAVAGKKPGAPVTSFAPNSSAPPDREAPADETDQGAGPKTGSVVMVPPAAPLPEPLPAPAEALPPALPPSLPLKGAAPGAPEHPGPKALVGLDEQATVRLLGEPSWTEDVPPAKYWQYATPSCVLRVFFFMEMTTQNFRALSYELTSSDDAPNVHERCFAQLLAQASGRQTAHGNRIQ
jgi:hypothetical protein